MIREKNILIILTPGFPEDENDTTCLPMQQQFVRELQRQNQDIKVIVLTFQYPYVTKTYSWHGIAVQSFNGRNKEGLYRIMLRKKLIRTLHNINEGNKIIGLLSFWFGECAWIGKTFSRQINKKHVCWLMGQDTRIGNPYPKRIPHEPGELIALSDTLQEEFWKNYGISPGKVITPGVDASLFTPFNSLRNIDIIGVGSLIPLKNYSLFLQVISSLRIKKPNLTAILVGGGPQEEHLKYLATKLGIKDAVHFTGSLPYTEVLNLMQRSKILLHPSSFEGFSGVCMEALASGCRVVSFCKPMRNDIKGWTIVKDQDEMERVVVQFLETESCEYGICENFDIATTVARIMEIFNMDQMKPYEKELIISTA